MAVTAKWYGNGIKHLLADTDLSSLKVMLTTSAYTPSQNTHEFKTDVTNEVTGTGYTAGGLALSSVTITQSGGSITFDAADSVWASSTITGRTAVVYKDTGTAATSPLILYQQSDVDISSTAGNWTITWNASGLGTVAV